MNAIVFVATSGTLISDGNQSWIILPRADSRNGDASRNLNHMPNMPNISIVPAAATALVATNIELRGAGRAPLGSAREVVVLIDCSKHLRSLFRHCSMT